MASNKLLKKLSQEKVEHERIFRVFSPKVFYHSNHAVGEVTLWYEISPLHALTEEIFANL